MNNLLKSDANENSSNFSGGETKNYNSFDLAKFICSILVVIIHVAPFGVQKNTNAFYYMNFVLQQGVCRIAVPLFFVFSGFFLYKKTQIESFSIQPTKKYLKRIISVYILWSIIYLPLSLMSIKENSIFIYCFKYTRRLLLQGSYTQFWYLTALIFAVALISALLYKKMSPKNILCASFVLYMIGLIGNGYLGILSQLNSLPFIGLIINIYFKIFVTVRNGLFFAFFFVSLGMYFSCGSKTISTQKALTYFLTSLFMMCFETLLLKRFNAANEYSFLVFLVPTTLFAFYFLKSLNLKDNKIYKRLRELSSLIFYLHMLVDFVVGKYLAIYNLEDTSIQFVATLALSMVTAFVIIKLSEKKGFRWLKRIY